MTNIVLFISVFICFMCHFLIINEINTENQVILLLYLYGLTTSFLNHGTTNNLIKHIDRISMKILFLINILLILIIYLRKKCNINLMINIYIILLLSGLFYYCSKLYNIKAIKNIFHIFAHICVTFVNLSILYLFCK